MAPRISVRPGELSALADELARLAVALAGDGDRCRSAAGVLADALGGREGAATATVATTWGTLAGELAHSTGAVAETLHAAVAAYRDSDAALAGRMGAP